MVLLIIFCGVFCTVLGAPGSPRGGVGNSTDLQIPLIDSTLTVHRSLWQSPHSTLPFRPLNDSLPTLMARFHGRHGHTRVRANPLFDIVLVFNDSTVEPLYQPLFAAAEKTWETLISR